MSQITCRKTLYWRQVPRNSGSLSEHNTPDPGLAGREQITEVFTTGKKYPITINIGGSDCGDVDISIYAIGNDGKKYPVLTAHDVLLSNRNISEQFIF
ncbi:MAG: hypothetical protein UR60_C0006G0019 [Candidatus Moranbacteria bacterium GW2011_GWF2_34_56]|nr:MAG: hypothetical protein UR51_C0005G0024 [Candidatus Moranbacteria bacterium GW2011_GWF1_34_10]KKP65197.1 MAG: hypothetical protein UR60_C0006G0019 [Candidatus Moranbacteria bacterium GW2011_GWF2_34_56]HBI17650.1 hypothetical protein [Candidatus Moranbacteria bacterium]